MKKAISLIMALALCLGLCACSEASVHGSEFIGTYEHKGTLTEYHSAYGYNNLVRDILHGGINSEWWWNRNF